MTKRIQQDETVEELKEIISHVGVPPQKRKFALGILRIFTVKKMAQAQVRATKIAREELKREQSS